VLSKDVNFSFPKSIVDLLPHITDCLCCRTDGTDGRARLGEQEGRRLLSISPHEGVRPASVDGVVEVCAHVVPTTVQGCTK